MFRKLIKKIGKGIAKVAKKIVKVQKKVWKGIKKVGGKVMKAINKAGVLGQIGLMLIMPYAMAGVGSLIGSAAGGISATWTGFGNWASSMMGSSNVFAKTVGHIARGVYHAGATAGKVITGVTKFIDTGFKAIANATGLPNPIEGFSNAVQSGYTKSFEATNNFLFGGTKIGATPEQLASAGVKPSQPFFKASEVGVARDVQTVKSGDTLSKIAQERGTTVEEIMNLNPELTDPNQINVGQRIRLPGESQALQSTFTSKYTQGQAQTYLDNLTETDLEKLKEFQPELYEELQTAASGVTDVTQQVNVQTEQSTLEKWGETAKDFVEDKAGDYAEKWANNRINNAIYGEDTTDTSIGFHSWNEIGKTIDVQNFFKQGDNYTPSLAAFYDEAENAFNSPAVGRI